MSSPSSPGGSGPASPREHSLSSSSSAPAAPPLSPSLLKSPLATSSGISEIRSESALVKRQRMAAEALKQLQSMPIHLGFSFDAVEENNNPYLGLLVDAIEPNSPAALAGLTSGDVVLEVNGARTLTLTDLLDAIRGLVPGTPIQFIVEREEQEVELIVTLGGKGQNQTEVLRLYSLVQSVQNGTDELVRTGALSLSDVLETPQFRIVLLQYMQANLCAESIEFLQVEQAYQRLPEHEKKRREYASHVIAQEFIDEHGAQMVNIDADSRKDCLTRLYQHHDISSLLFHDAAKVVYKMVENDVFRRFTNSAEYQAMVHEPGNTEAIAIRAKRRRTPSWAIIPFEDQHSELEEISLSFAKTPHVQDRRYHLKKYKSCFKGSDLVHWLCEAGYAKNRPSATAIGQRLWDGFYLFPVAEEFEFDDSDKLFTFLSPLTAEPVGVQELFMKAGGSSSPNIFSTSLLVKGVRYTRLFTVVNREKKKLFLFRNAAASCHLIKVRLKGAQFFVQQGPQAVISKKEKGEKMPSISALSLSAANSSPINVFDREIITYLNLENPNRNLTFRFENEDDSQNFIAVLNKCGATLTQKEFPL